MSQLIHHTIDNFNIQPDKLALGRINESLSTLQQSRALRLREAEDALRALSRNHSTLASQHKETVSAHDSVSHAAEISELDTKKFRIAKSASEVEIETERLEGELEGLKARLADLEMQGVEGDDQARREREADDATMWALLTESIRWEHGIADRKTDCNSRSTDRSVSTSSRMRLEITIKPSSGIRRRGMCTWSTLIPSFPSSFMRITSGRRSRPREDAEDTLLIFGIAFGESAGVKALGHGMRHLAR